MAASVLRKGFCFDCERIKGIRGRGLCDACHRKRQRRGTLHQMPKTPLTIEKYKEFLMIREYEPETSARLIAKRIGVDIRTIQRYNAYRNGKLVIKCLQAVGL